MLRATWRVPPSLAAIVALGCAVRLAGIGFGLPYVFHPDEATSIRESLGLLSGVTDALSFANPPLYKYLLSGVFDTLFSTHQLPDAETSSLYVVARAASAVFGALTVVVVYFLGRLAHSHRVGLIAAGLGAVTYLLVRESHFGVNDSLATLLTAVALAACIGVARRGARADYLVAGVATGLAFAAKYQALAVLVPLVLAHAQHGRARRDVDLGLGLGAGLVAVVVAFPPAFTETRRVVADIYVFLMLPSRLGFEGLDPAGAYVFYIKTFGWGIGWPMLALACYGAVRAIVCRHWPLICVASLAAVLYVFMGSSRMYAARFMLPAVPALVTLSAFALDDIARYGRWIPVVLTGVVLAGTLPSTLEFDMLLSRTDTRTSAHDWLREYLPANARIAVDPMPYGPPLDGVSAQVIRSQGRALADTPLQTYRTQGVEYLITSSYLEDATTLDPDLRVRRGQFSDALRSQAQVIAEFSPDKGGPTGYVFDRIYGPFDSLDEFDRPGPTITVYRISGQV